MHRLSWQVGGARRDPDRAADRALGRPTSAPSSPRSCLPRPGQPEPRSRHRRQCSPRGRPPREPRPPAPQPALQFNKKLIFASPKGIGEISLSLSSFLSFAALLSIPPASSCLSLPSHPLLPPSLCLSSCLSPLCLFPLLQPPLSSSFLPHPPRPPTWPPLPLP